MVTFNNGRNSEIYTKPPFMNSRLWQQFRSSVIWRACWKGQHCRAIAGIPLTSENYSLVVKLLQERFGRKEAIVESYFRLQNLPKTGNKFADIQRVSETIEKVLRQQEAQGKFIDEQRVLIQQIISKYYPPEVITKLEEGKGNTLYQDNWPLTPIDLLQRC